MSPELGKIIKMFNETQVESIKILEKHFECPRPTDCMDFITRCVQIIRKKNYDSNGYKIKPHGIGMIVHTDNRRPQHNSKQSH